MGIKRSDRGSRRPHCLIQINVPVAGVSTVYASTRRSTHVMNARTPDGSEQPLAIPVDTVCFIVDMLREYENTELLTDAADETAEKPAPMDAEDLDVYTERENDYRSEPVRQELESFIHDLPEDQQVDLVALMWLGRDNSSAEDWPGIRQEASQAHNARTALYLLGSPLASDFLEEGLSILGHASGDTEDRATRNEP